MNGRAYSNTDTEPLSLEALQAGDRQEFARLVEQLSPYIYRLSMRMLGNTQDAEDVLQETFIKAFQHLENFDGRSKISTWLYRIATNEALMLIRKRKHVEISLEQSSNVDTDPLDEPVHFIDWTTLPEQELMSEEVRAYLRQAVDGLPPSMRAVFLLREIEELSTMETAQVLNISDAAVKTRLSRARLQLREKLSSYFGERLKEGSGYEA